MNGSNGKPNGTGGNGQPGGSGGEPAPTKVGELDLADRGDRDFLRRAVSGGWGVTPEKMQRYSTALDAALGLALQAQDHRAVQSCVRTLATIVGQVQADQHMAVNLAARAAGLNDIEVRVVFEDAPAPMLE